MGIFDKRKEDSINPVILEGFINKVKDIVLTAEYDGTIETINKQELKEKYKTLSEFFERENNSELYDDMIRKLMDESSFVEDIEITREGEKTRLYVAAYNVQTSRKFFFYIKDVNLYLLKEKELLEEIDKQDEILKSKDLFIANLSHEIKTPMNIIVGMIYFLKETALDEKQLEYVNKLDEASKILLEMISGTLNLSENKQYAPTSFSVDFNLKKFLDNIIEMFKEKAAQKNLDLYSNIDFDYDINIHADKSKLNHIFINLIDNAVKYTDKGYIEISARKIEENNICYKLQFCLKDTGVGIKKEDTLKIFREFSQVEDPTTKTKDGKGLGLSITKKIIEDMNGKIWVESSVGLGSKFYFDITLDKCNRLIDESNSILADTGIKTTPEHNLEETQTQTKEQIQPQIQANHELHVPVDENRQKRILLVEDNDMNIEITKKLLSELDYICDVAEDGIICLKQVQKVGVDYYDLILMDIHLPKYNGYEISKILKQDLNVKAPIVALTATNVTDRSIQENANYIKDYILKPIAPAEFKEKIKTYLELNNVNHKQNAERDNILLFSDSEIKIRQLKEKLNRSFNEVITTAENDIDIFLQTESIKAIIVDELEDIDKEISIVKNIKVNSNASNIPIILISRNVKSTLKERLYEIMIDGIVESNEIEQCDVAVYNILSKIREKSELKGLVKKSKEEIENVYNFLFESMVNLTSVKSKETGEHLKRTKEYMKVMLAKYEEFYGEGLFTNRETIEDIAMAAVLHDIGKVGIPDNILNKPGKLTDEEYEIMKSHTTIGRNILETTYGNKVSNNILNYAKDIVYHHHEKYDGTGYPEHLEGDEISIISKIMALIDVYDALANKRVYKPAWPYEEIEELMANESGKSFDPKVVNIFSQVKDKLKEINEQYKDKE